jgi:hypothetical protein
MLLERFTPGVIAIFSSVLEIAVKRKAEINHVAARHSPVAWHLMLLV